MKIFFIGIAGAGMHSLALYLSEAGHEVCGSDCGASQEICEFWAKRGCRIFTSHEAKHVQGADLVVYSAAIPKDNPERIAAENLNIACSRGEALARFANQHPMSVAVCGTHGKGTTAAAISFLLAQSGLRTGDILGAVPIGRTQPTQFVPDSQVLVCEVDESDRTHLFHRPGILLINNVEADHLNQYRDLDDIVETFASFVIKNLEHGSKVIVHYAGVGAPKLYDLLKAYSEIFWICEDQALPGSFLSYTLDAPDHAGRCKLKLWSREGETAEIIPSLGGRANAQNLASAVMAGKAIGISMQDSAKILALYQGLNDRCQIYDVHGRLIVTDYASHPTCVMNDIGWIKSKARKVTVIYHPYRYTLMQYHWNGLIKALSEADNVWLLPFDPCGETAIEGISDLDMARAITESGGHAQAFDSHESCIKTAIDHLSPGDALIIFAGHSTFEQVRAAASHT